ALGIAGLTYMGIVIGRMLRQQQYKPVVADWAWFAGAPVVGYLFLFIGAARLRLHHTRAADAAATAVLILLLASIHNAWDAAVWIAVGDRGASPTGDANDQSTMR